jgi:hypothetical protein
MASGSTQPLTEMSMSKLPVGKGRLEHKADNLTAVCEPIVYKTWEPRHLTTLRAFTACYRDRFAFFTLLLLLLAVLVAAAAVVVVVVVVLSFSLITGISPGTSLQPEVHPIKYQYIPCYM